MITTTLDTYEGLFMKSSMLLLEFYVSKPWLDAARFPEDILLVYGVFTRLERYQVSLR